MKLRGSWRNATEPLIRLSGNGANATVSRIAATTALRLQTTLTPAQEAVAGALGKTLLGSELITRTGQWLRERLLT